jgi:hypothetical protein
MTTDTGSVEPSPSSWILVGIAWLAVSIPLVWGIWQTVKKAAVLFR